MLFARSRAASEQENTVRPGGRARAFCTPARRTSMPSASMPIGTAENDETESTTSRTPGKDLTTLAMPARSFITPVEVSLWMSVTRSNPPSSSFARTAAGEIASPHSTWIFSAGMPILLATSNHLSEKAPQQSVRTFFAQRLRSEASITPHADEVERKNGRLVPASCLSTGWVDA